MADRLSRLLQFAHLFAAMRIAGAKPLHFRWRPLM
jgi:hypothetical protein